MRSFIDSILRSSIIFLMGFLVVDVFWQVFSRYVLADPSTFTDELAGFLLIWVSLLGAAYMSGQNRHIAITLLPDRLGEDANRKVQIVIRLLVITFVALVFIIGGGNLMLSTIKFQQITPSLNIPMAYVYMIGPISGLLIVYYKISDLLEFLSAHKKQEHNT